MKRRHFFKTTAIGSAVLAATGMAACTQTNQSVAEKTFDPSFFELNEITIQQLQQKMESGEMTSEAICKTYLERIAAVDPIIHSIIELNPDALSIAAQMDGERKEGKVRGLLHGIPVLIKDNIDTADKMQTTAGSLALEGNIAPEDAFIVARLRAAGAVILGKTNLSEWANFRSSRSSSGWSGRGGQTRNPFSPDRSPCGSSSGSGAAISANLCAIAIGTETDGSIVCPSGINGIVGIKPTLGLWSRRGIIPIAHSQDTAGPMCRTVTDAAILLGALAAHDEKDAKPLVEPGKIENNFTQYLDADGLKGARIGIARSMSAIRGTEERFEKAIETLKKLGAEIIDPVVFDSDKKWDEPSFTVLLYEFKADLNRYLATHPLAKPRNMEEIIAFNIANNSKEMPWFEQELMLAAQATTNLEAEAYKQALADSKRFAQQEGIDKIMKEHQLDAIIAPTNGPSWNIDCINGDHYTGGSSSAAAIAGYPSITVPMGFYKGLPLGLSFFGKAWSEPVLIRLAYAFEQAAQARKVPGFKVIGES